MPALSSRPPLCIRTALTDYARSGVQAALQYLQRLGKPAAAMRLEGAPICIGIPGIVETSEHLHIAGHALQAPAGTYNFCAQPTT